MVGLEDWVPPFAYCGRGWVWLAWAPPAPGTALSKRGELKTSPALSSVGAQMRTRQATGSGAGRRGGGRRRGGERVGRWLGTHRGRLGPARVRGPHCGSAEPVPVSLARLLWLPERQLAGRVGPIFSDSMLPPARRPRDWLRVGHFRP